MQIHIYHEKEPVNIAKKLIFIAIFFTITPIAILASSLSLISLGKSSDQTATQNTNLIKIPKPGIQVYAALPEDPSQISEKIVADDARVSLVADYLKNYNSPLYTHAEFLVKTADKYGLDYRLLTAIAQQESNLCKRIPPESYNCWGWGIHSAGTLHFSSFEEGIDTVSKGLKEKYIDLGYTTPEEIMSKYTPSSNGSWANGVELFMSQME